MEPTTTYAAELGALDRRLGVERQPLEVLAACGLHEHDLSAGQTIGDVIEGIAAHMRQANALVDAYGGGNHAE